MEIGHKSEQYWGHLRESEMERAYSSFLIALTCLLIPGLVWVFTTTQLFGLSIKLAEIHVTG